MSLPAHLSSPREARVSIAMATYNGARFIQEQLDSFLAQTHLPWELVITDDQSTDATEQIVNAFAQKAPFRVRFIRNEDRLYFSSNFMKAASLCEGDFIAFSDQDDIWDPRKIELSLDALAQPGVVLCVHDATKVNEQGEPVGLETRKRVPKGVLGDIDPLIGFSGFVCTFPRELITLVDPESRPDDVIEEGKKLAHDRWISYLALLVGKIANLAEPLAKYRQHDCNVSTWAREKRSRLELLKAIREKSESYLLKRHLILKAYSNIAENIEQDGLNTILFSKGQLATRRIVLRDQANTFQRRLAIARSGNFVGRIKIFTQCVAGGSYSNSLGGIGRMRSLAMDALMVFNKPSSRDVHDAQQQRTL